MLFCNIVSGGTLGSFLPGLQKTIASFHMPLFFFVSGFLYKFKYPKDYFYSKVCGLLIPYILIQLINWLLSNIVSLFCMVLHISNFSSMMVLEGYWFILVLLFISIVYYVIQIALKDKRLSSVILILVSICFLLCGLGYSYFINGVSTVVTQFIGFFYFAIGVEIKRHKHFNIVFQSRMIIIGFGVLFLCVTYIIADHNLLVTMARNEYGNPILFFVCSLFGILGCCFVGYGINKNRILEFFGKNTLIVLTTQFPVYRLTQYVLRSLCEFEAINVFGCFIITCLIEIAFIRFVNRFFPLFAGRFPYRMTA